ncbi:MAG: TIGR00153 family protein [Chlamydiae bacterium]|nr:TIGR00153 family protein [Chlamydiota bacterium]
MISIARLFGKSPFAPLQTHMKKVTLCVEKLTSIIDVLSKMDREKIEKLSRELSALEHEADITKNDIRNHLPKNIFLPIDRSHFLEILSVQDSIADKAEEIALLLSMLPLEKFSEFKENFELLYKKNAEVFWNAKKIIEEIDELLESSFGGIEAEKVKAMVEQTAFKEHEAVKIQHTLMKDLYSKGSDLSAPSFHLWITLVEQIGNLSALSERLANQIRMVLELK